jgi:predicted nucleotidyltransferase
MKKLDDLKLSEKELNAIYKLKRKLLDRFPRTRIILYGSKIRGNSEDFSDIDILVLLDRKIDSELEKQILDIAYEIELESDIVFGVMIESKDFWDSSLARIMPLHQNIEKEGVLV